MLRFPIGRHSDCQAVNRREFLQVGAVGAFGLSLPGLLRSQAAAAEKPRQDRNCILLWMGGGPSHHDSFDPKPDAPVNVRGDFQAIQTAVPGVHFGEHLPRMAAALKQYTLLRSLNPRNGAHGTADAYMMSGHAYTPAMTYPCFGSVISQEKGDRRGTGMPPFLQLGTDISGMVGGGTAGFLGNAHNPYVVPGDPNSAAFSVRDITPPKGVSFARVERRLKMLQSLDQWQDHMERSDLVTSMDTFYQKAHSLLTSPEAKRAFDLSRESDRVRDGYGRTTLGQSCLLARRLIEAGVRFVTVTDGGWDTHGNNFNILKTKKLPPLDQALPCLLEDLKDRGLLESTLVVWMGDFGRTPQINVNQGRDHWASVGNVIFAGGGTKRGVVGATDGEGGNCVRNQYFTEDVAATLYQQLGVPLDTVFTTPDGRPIHFWVGKPIPEIV
jgi:uncharacterized protein (DUF1501 family)